MRRAVAGLAMIAVAAGFVWPQASTTQQNNQEQLASYRNLGKAFYENPTTQQQAVEMFQKALELNPDSVRERVNYGMALLRAGKTDEGIAELLKAQQQDPKIPHTWFNLGIAYKKAGEYEKAIAEFEQMVKLVPDEPVSHYNLGYLYRLTDKTDQAVREFEIAEKLDASLAGPHFQLYNAYRAAGRADDAARELNLFQQIRQQQAGAAIPEDLDWSFYAEIYDIIEPPTPTAPVAELRFDDRQIADGFDPLTAGLAVLDFNADGRTDLIAWSGNGVHLFRDGSEAVESAAGLGSLRSVRSIAPGDFNNDGFADLAVIADTGATLYLNQNGQFQRSPVQLPTGQYAKAVWIDYDHDYDLDLILLGDKSALARNNGSAGFSDRTNDFPFVEGQALDGVVMDLDPNGNGFDLVVSYSDRPGVIYRDRLGGKYEAESIDGASAGASVLSAHDWNNDSWTDLVMGYAAKTLMFMNRSGTLENASTIEDGGTNIAFVDLANRGLPDLVAGGFIHSNLGRGQFGERGETPYVLGPWEIADFDLDGKHDFTVVRPDGSLRHFNNKSQGNYNWTQVSLTGVKNLKLAMGARVEVRAGRLYLKQTYQGVPLTFGLGSHTQIDTLRITWPNGLIQNEVNQPVNKALSFTEAQRLSGSCPMIFTWNGQYFQFITDVLGVAPLGATLGDGKYFPVDHDEYIQIPGSALRNIDGMYEIRITEELREVSYLDKVQLMAVDHPASTDIYSNDKFKGPPFPEFRLFGVSKRVYPETARDQHGNDVLPRLLKRDLSYPDSFQRDYSGVAELHSMDLDFGTAAPDNQAILVLSGWVDWADGSTFRAVSQESTQGLVMPYLQVKDAAGNWKTVIEDMGMPAGKPKTIVVDLTGKFLSASREVRIVTSLALYWDEIFLSEDSSAPQLVLTPLDADSADLRFRGFSKPLIHPERKQPEQFDYQQWMAVSMWNPTPGMYTRYGDVRPLVLKADDQLVLMGSGDELRLLYPDDQLPALPEGWRRDFLLLVDGWAKDQDANTAFATSVEPLPFHGMSQYPYPASEHFPDDSAHRAWREQYNTRPALRLVRPLVETTQQRGQPFGGQR
ncbi:MAG: VCBS repeat-containing protein [Acidobacteria bacterium]|nr:VCBS repeat-containing protein [Acidobacteriota bacterium]